MSKHGITVNFHKGLNALIGENDSGKSAIIDAIKLVLQTQSGEFTRVTDEDFYISATGEIATEFSIDCTFEGFEINEAKNFIEWLSFEKDKTSGAVFYKLLLHYRAWRENGRIYTETQSWRYRRRYIARWQSERTLKMCLFKTCLLYTSPSPRDA